MLRRQNQGQGKSNVDIKTQKQRGKSLDEKRYIFDIKWNEAVTYQQTCIKTEHPPRSPEQRMTQSYIGYWLTQARVRHHPFTPALRKKDVTAYSIRKHNVSTSTSESLIMLGGNTFYRLAHGT